MSERFDEAYWEQRYRGHGPGHRREPNPYLVAAVADRAPGVALDAGCGEGAEAGWLAARGWRVTAVDIAATALRHAREHATALGPDVADRIDWVRADLTGWTPPAQRYDLVCAHYVHPATDGPDLLRRLAAAVAPGGTLLVVGHAPSPANPAAGATVEEATAVLDAGRWEVQLAEARSRTAAGHHGHDVTLHDTVVRARRRP
ncbi:MULTISPECIES: bifunctional 2-polyprenyl-6-hydroxyphenol methylase/3-demethylubiquinol 3-O-methyltransferase UbiG [Micromonospora]|uniref:Class I SAM-dependent methyltransferase n=1 Tax=Micromonospora solifontis TaxID=2487138 RepID=A0ABX9WFH2_9ACTN|nr:MULTISPECIES: class I SAM-dependent methyltransferase [Micromonospora]NES15095.1 class I SAM-dependent methyltransferase [Micromonospora sp. PPF5-17B]NES37195.1 class I SAM-dependent methyltransferase [Micromonospora solifontis]NES56230.1 class I SAM-dependent methyltransferase [Micromonospora sp. PPF5-6]RNL98642.1 class I SAM-dependent methyltransferase [Micromonospora solifontis]